jgi:hemerythrin
MRKNAALYEAERPIMHTIPPTGAAHAIGTALQHTRKQLCHQIDELAARPDAAFASGWSALVAATEAAFRHEESVMELMAYAGLAAHREENARTLSALHHVTPQVDGGDTGIGRAALDALAAIVAAHRYSVGLATTDLHLRGHKAAPRNT